MEALESRLTANTVDPCIRLGLFLTGTLDSELLFAIFVYSFVLPRGGNTKHKNAHTSSFRRRHRSLYSAHPQ